jgi:two-component system chemotaxis response regulator CheB
LRRGLEAADIEVVGVASDPYIARDLLVQHRPDVMTLDIEMPRMDGVTFLRKVMAVLPTPTVIVSSLAQHHSAAALSALDAGAVDVVAKPSSDVAGGLHRMLGELVDRVRMAARSKVVLRETEQTEPSSVASAVSAARARTVGVSTDTVIGLGASTGGVAALGRILPMFPADAPGVLVVQHMPAGFTAGFADRMRGVCAMRVAEAKSGDRVLRGHLLLAPGGKQHLEVHRIGGEYRVVMTEGPPVSGHCPSVDVFFRSLAQHVGQNAAACLLTGMGADGAEGLKALRSSGGHTYAQDEATSAVWGMPGAAVELGAVERTVPLNDVAATLLAATRR